MQVNKPVNKPSKDLQFLLAIPILKFDKKWGVESGLQALMPILPEITLTRSQTRPLRS